MKRTLKGIRNDLGFTQEQMANELGIPAVTYQRYEVYKSNIPVSIIVKIADLCKIVDIRDIKYE